MKYFKTFPNNGSLGLFQGHLDLSLDFRISCLDLADFMRVNALLFLKFGLFGLFSLEYLSLELIYRPIELTTLLFKFGNFKILKIRAKIPFFVFSYQTR
jgi:hypothetical protein